MSLLLGLRRHDGACLLLVVNCDSKVVQDVGYCLIW